MDSRRSNLYVGVVDDDESTCRSLSRLLRAVGMQPITYLSAEDFLHDSSRPKFDCVVVDVQLTGMSGIELQQKLSETEGGSPPPPIVFITAHDDPEAEKQALRAGCAAYLRKTAPGETVIGAIRQAVAGRSAGT